MVALREKITAWLFVLNSCLQASNCRMRFRPLLGRLPNPWTWLELHLIYSKELWLGDAVRHMDFSTASDKMNHPACSAVAKWGHALWAHASKTKCCRPAKASEWGLISGPTHREAGCDGLLESAQGQVEFGADILQESILSALLGAHPFWMGTLMCLYILVVFQYWGSRAPSSCKKRTAPPKVFLHCLGAGAF